MPDFRATDFPVFQFARGGDVVDGDLDEMTAGQVVATRIANQHQRAPSGKSAKPGKHPCRHFALVADIARNHRFPALIGPHRIKKFCCYLDFIDLRVQLNGGQHRKDGSYNNEDNFDVVKEKLLNLNQKVCDKNSRQK